MNAGRTERTPLLYQLAGTLLLAFGVATGGVLFLWRENPDSRLAVATGLYCFGALLVLVAKLRSWRVGPHTDLERIPYLTGYALMAAALLVSAVVVLF